MVLCSYHLLTPLHDVLMDDGSVSILAHKDIFVIIAIIIVQCTLIARDILKFKSFDWFKKQDMPKASKGSIITSLNTKYDLTFDVAIYTKFENPFNSAFLIEQVQRYKTAAQNYKMCMANVLDIIESNLPGVHVSKIEITIVNI